MDFLKEVFDVGRRATVDALHSGSIEQDSPHSPEVPEDLRENMPDLFDRFPLVLPWSKPEPIDPALHTVWILDNAAFQTPPPGESRPHLAALVPTKHAQPKLWENGGEVSIPAESNASGWEAEFVACYFIKNSGRDVARVVARIAHELEVPDDDIATRSRISARIQPFVDTVLPKRTVRIALDEKVRQTLGPSSYSGISSGLYKLHFTPSLTQPFPSNPVHLPAPFAIPSLTIASNPTGWGIISDIDDTLKITQTPSPTGILHSTFIVEDPEPVPGMPELYAQLRSALRDPSFFYLSASPYNLYPFLRHFRESHYPTGPIILRDASWQNLGGLIASLQQGTKAYKVDRIVKIHAWFPGRTFVCVGDSTQQDPEAYGEVARRFPGWVKGIFIRRVTGIAEMDEAGKNSKERFEKAFEGLESRLWCVFEEPSEVLERVGELVGSTKKGDR